eukprot:TRINITY_DN3798_c1_g1_i1.p1 TRINITY_DN3798_c1_g1~~TRINITY_DN3798_c1_g1_i1.p1  ORF type:complete len:1053 (-),score=172.89 TRINITY_DN3798_c1_g1_i1:297-3455(-)
MTESSSSTDAGFAAAAAAAAAAASRRMSSQSNRGSRISEESQVSHPGSVMSSVCEDDDHAHYTFSPLAAMQELCRASSCLLFSSCRRFCRRCRRNAELDSDSDSDCDEDDGEDEVWEPMPMRISTRGPTLKNHWICDTLLKCWHRLRRFSFLGLNDWAFDDEEENERTADPQTDQGILPTIPSGVQHRLSRANTTATVSSLASGSSDQSGSCTHRDSRRNTFSRRESFDHGRGKSFADLAWMHKNRNEMAMQMRDKRIKMSFYDAIDVDAPPSPFGKGCCSRRFGKPLVRAFSPAAVVLAYVRLILSAWSFLVTLCIIAFWRSLHLADLPPPLGSGGPSSSNSSSSRSTMLPQVLVADLILDSSFLMCLLLQLKTTVLQVNSGSEMCNGWRILWWNLKDMTFWLDLVSCVPILALWPSSPPRGRMYFGLKLLRAWRFFHTPPIYVFRPSDYFDLFRTILAIFMGAHVFGMIWLMIVYEVDGTLDQHMEERGNLAHAFVVCEADALAHLEDCVWAYACACWQQGMYLMLGVDRTAKSALDHLFVAITTPCGLLVNAYLLGGVLMLIQRRSLLSSKRLAKSRSQEEAMSVLGLPDNLQMRIKAFTTYEHIHASGRVFEEIFTGLNPQLRFELSMHLYADFLDKSRLFRTLRPHVIRELMVLLEDVIYLPGDWVCRTGDYGNCMYFMVKGHAVMLHKDGDTELRSLRRGSYFGEVSLLMGMPWNIYVRANSFCIMARLTHDSFSPIFQRWPEDMDVLLKHHSAESAVSRREVKAAALRNFGLRTCSSDSKSNKSSKSGRALHEVGSDGSKQPHEQRSASKPELMPALREREEDDDDEGDGPRKGNSQASIVSRAASISSAPERIVSREFSNSSVRELVRAASVSSIHSRCSDMSLEDVKDHRPGLPSLLAHREHRVEASTVEAMALKQSTAESTLRRPSVVVVTPPEDATSSWRRSAMPPKDDVPTIRERLSRAGNLQLPGLLNEDHHHTTSTTTLGLPRKRSSIELAPACGSEVPGLLGVPESHELRLGRRSSDRSPVREKPAPCLERRSSDQP